MRHCSKMLLQCALVHAVAALHPNGVKIFYDPKHATHSNAKGHPETPRRVDDCRRALEKTDATWQYLKRARTDAEDSVRRVHSHEHDRPRYDPRKSQPDHISSALTRQTTCSEVHD